MTTRIRTIIALMGAAVALLGLSSAASAASFGPDLSADTEPTYSTGRNGCTGVEYLKRPCTWLMDEALDDPDGAQAPKSGKLDRIKLVAGEPGKFELQIVRERMSDRAAKLVTQGPTIRYGGQDGSDANGSEVESFDLHGLRIHEGDRLAIAAKHTSAMACGPKGSRTVGSSTIVYTPVLKGSPMFEGLGSANGCHLLIEGFVK